MNLTPDQIYDLIGGLILAIFVYSVFRLFKDDIKRMQ